MANCNKCGAQLQPGMKFCTKCGQPVNLQPQSPTPPQGINRPQRPQPLKVMSPQPMRPQATSQPQRPVMPQKPAQPQRPVMPQAPHTPQDNKGMFTNAVRTVANAMTGGALNRQIAEEQRRAVNQQTASGREEIRDAQDAQHQAERAQIAAEREAGRSRDRRSMEAVDGVDVVRGRTIWNIQPGEIARKISERELEEIEKLKGIIVQEGCTAIIFADGELVSTLSAGAYLFYKSVEEEQAAIKAAVEKAEKQMEEAEKRERDRKRQAEPTFRQLGIVGEVGRGFNWLGRIIFGEKKGEQKEKAKKRKLDYARILARITQPPILSVYLVSNRFITLTFGGMMNESGELSFQPYTIPIGIHDVQVGVSLQMRITDIHSFATNYLADRNSVTTRDLQQQLNGTVETLLRQSLRNQNYEQSGLTPEIIAALKAQILQTINQQVYGVECTQVLNITDNNQDFERFRQVERQLYNTEKELDFMHRTGEFRNRMEVEANSQQIDSAKNAEELRHALQTINKDQILHDDELEEFVQLLESQKRIRQAKTEEEEFEALEGLRKNRLVKQEEMEVLEDELAHKKIPREEITEIMRIQSQQNIDAARLQSEWALDDSRTDHDWEREDLERRRNWGIEDEEREREWIQEEKKYNRDFDRKAKEDDYDFKQIMRQRELDKEDNLLARNEKLEDDRFAYERNRQEKLDDDQLEGNRHQRQMEKLQQMAQMQAQLDQQKYQHEENVATIQSNEQMNRDNQFANMTAEQIRAAQLSHLSEEAQVAMANAYNGERGAATIQQTAQEKEALMQQMLQMQQQNSNAQMEAMMKMAGMIKDTATGISGAQQSQQQQRIDQLEAENRHQQERVDQTQDKAMDNIAQVSTAAANNLNAFNGGLGGKQQEPATPQQELIECQCYNCGHTIHIAPGTPNCPDCGAPFQW